MQFSILWKGSNKNRLEDALGESTDGGFTDFRVVDRKCHLQRNILLKGQNIVNLKVRASFEISETPTFQPPHTVTKSSTMAPMPSALTFELVARCSVSFNTICSGYISPACRPRKRELPILCSPMDQYNCRCSCQSQRKLR